MRLSYPSYTRSQAARAKARGMGKGTRRLRAWHVYLSLGALVTGAYFLAPSQTVQHTLRLLLIASALTATITGIFLHRPGRPLPWYLFAAALVMSILGTLTYGYYEVLVGMVAPLVTLADAFFIASYSCAAAALLLIQSRRLVRDRASTIDPIIISVGAGMLAWVYLMQPYAEDPSLTLVERSVSMAYPC